MKPVALALMGGKILLCRDSAQKITSLYIYFNRSSVNFVWKEQQEIAPDSSTSLRMTRILSCNQKIIVPSEHLIGRKIHREQYRPIGQCH
jgi:hypothetical protein